MAAGDQVAYEDPVAVIAQRPDLFAIRGPDNEAVD